MASAEVGSTANNYEILARLAVGGMAEIFLARSVSGTGVARYCVLKRILRDRASDVDFVRMFLEEARLAAQLQHPNVAQVYDIGKLGDSYFFTMEYVHGETVRAILHRARSLQRELPVSTVLGAIAGAAAGLHHAHERIGIDGRPLGIVHRDVSPSNLIVSFEGGVKLVDFGVAKAADRAQETRSGTVKGKIGYLSPEQCVGNPIDRRSDLFSLGIVMWEMLVVERLYKRESDFANMTAIVKEPPVPPSQLRPSVPRELDAIAMRLLEKDPGKRYQTAEQVVEALEEASVRLGAVMSPSGLGRYLREMFGPRPEPWVELERGALSADTVRVAGEPVPADLHIPVAHEVDLRLRDVPTLHASAEDSQNSLSRGAAPLAVPSQLGPGGFSGPNLYGTGFAAPSTPASGSHQSSFHGEGQPSYPSAAGFRVAPVTEPEPRSPLPRLIVVIVTAAVTGSVAVWLAMNDDDKPTAKPVASAQVVIDAMSAVAVDAEIVELVDAPVASDATVRVAEPTVVVDAASIDRAPSEALRAFDAGDYEGAYAHCVKEVSGDTAVPCTLAACKLRQEAKARQWYARITQGRPAVAAACKAEGVAVTRPAVRARDAGVDCEANPMACRE